MLEYVSPLDNGKVIVIHSDREHVTFSIVLQRASLIEHAALVERCIFVGEDVSRMNFAVTELVTVARKVFEYVKKYPRECLYMDVAYDLLDEAEKRILE